MTSGVSVISVRATDEDENDAVTYTIQSGEEGGGASSQVREGAGHPVR